MRQQFELNLPCVTPAVVSRTRGIARHLFDGFGVPEPMAYDAGLVITELLTNVHQHTRQQSCVLGVAITCDVMHLHVIDGCQGMPVRVLGPGEGMEGGRGLQLVHALASSWGVERVIGGKRVWVDLSLVDTGREAPRC